MAEHGDRVRDPVDYPRSGRVERLVGTVQIEEAALQKSHVGASIQIKQLIEIVFVFLLQFVEELS